MTIFLKRIPSCRTKHRVPLFSHPPSKGAGILSKGQLDIRAERQHSMWPWLSACGHRLGEKKHELEKLLGPLITSPFRLCPDISKMWEGAADASAWAVYSQMILSPFVGP
ncbi:hypothetical protein D9757_009754 [Collybiopsis confluens]|uniref:Uncharacterized protein n=1 Tax=Collybiopsis confluens TaxID=2823264 RepID=A0A8H5GYE2_9AGAR|nr:hypothetical protein D9757_009754 [Collybiopsis confluens]